MRPARVALLYSLWPALAQAAGFYVPDLGVNALGRAGAFVARADDLTAAWYNPAGLADQGGTRFHGDVGVVKQSVFFQRTDERGSTAGYPPVGNTSIPYVIPFLGLSSDFGLRDLSFSLSVYGPYAGLYQYPDSPSAPQRYSLISGSVWEAVYGQISAGWRVTRWLRLGASFQWVEVKASQKLALSVMGTQENEGGSDARVQFDVADRFTPNTHLGLIVSPTPFLDFGFSVKMPMPVNCEGTLRVDQGDLMALRTSIPALQNLGVTGERVSVSFELPLILRTGLRYKHPRFDIETDVIVERWTGFSKLSVVPQDIQYTFSSPTPIPLPPIVQDRGYGWAYSVRLGSDFEILPGRLTGRLGYYFETSAIPARSLNVSAMDMDKHGAAVGVTAKFGWFSLSLAYAHVQLLEQRVLDSSSRQINLTYIAFNLQDQAPPVGRGIYRSGYDILALGIGVDIDTLAGWKRAK
jgi:long-chain fatty acid transport protein